MTFPPGAARKSEQRRASRTATGPSATQEPFRRASLESDPPARKTGTPAGQGGPCHYKDKSPRAGADQREGSPTTEGRARGDKRATPFQARNNLLSAVERALQAEGKEDASQVAGTARLRGDGTERGAQSARRAGERLGAARRAVATAAAAGVLPKHVRNCNGGAGARSWWLYTWKRSDPAKKLRIPYNCSSWRCPHCARYEASVTFARIKAACEPLTGDGFVFFVLTLDREGYYSRSGGRWKNVTEAFKDIGKLSEKFLKRLRRLHKRMGWAPFKSKWVATVEAHRTGWPHLNIVLHSPELAEYLENDRAARERRGFSDREQVLVQDELRRCVVGAGWGPQSTAERGRSKEALAGYITKLAGVAGSTAGEVAKITQAPTQAPERFRRLRAGTKFLPPRITDPEVTGTLVRRYHLIHGPTVLPIHAVKGEDAKREIALCCEHEERLQVEELAELHTARMLARCGLVKQEQPVTAFRVGGLPEQFAPPLEARGSSRDALPRRGVVPGFPTSQAPPRRTR